MAQFGISVVFYERGYWSKAYTFLSETPIEKGAKVLVPAGRWYGVAKVVSCTENPVLNPEITYKSVIEVLKLT
jgi:hypothetical protein